MRCNVEERLVIVFNVWMFFFINLKVGGIVFVKGVGSR